MMSAAGKPSKGIRLPELRQDLTVIDPGAVGEAGKRWLIYDPVRHHYCEVDATSLEMLRLWRAGQTVDGLISAVERATGKRIAADDIIEFLQFAEAEKLLADPAGGDWRAIAATAARVRSGATKQLIHSYLFFKVPLVHPQAFLQRTLWIARMLASRTATALLAMTGLIGLYLVSRQWDEFLATFAGLWSIEGALSFAIAIVFVKVLHELGHAYTAVNYGCRVPAMGVAFMVMTPILYTDVTDAWRLGSRRSRLAIDAAGVVAELKLAALATFLWPFLPPGTLKGIVFVIATTSWLMSLAINLNPFMRFDGYYILADLMGISNLQPRAFALARWRLREFLFGLGEPAPELLPPGRRRQLIAYAVATWIYRLVLFIGIALLVYHFFFKVLGVLLFIIEIIFFIARPIWSEILEWRKRMPAILSRPRSYVTASIVAALIAGAFIPWSGRVDVPVIVEPTQIARIFPPRAAEIAAVRVVPGQHVKSGDVVAELQSDKLDAEIALVETRIRATRVRLARVAADIGDREQIIVLERELQSLLAERAGLSKVKSDLVLRAPLSGQVVELTPALHEGRFVPKTQLLFVIAGGGELQARGYVSEGDVRRIAAGNAAQLIFNDGRIAKLHLSVAEVGESGVDNLELSDLGSIYSGPVDAVWTQEKKIAPVTAQYPVRFTVDADPDLLPHRIRGLAVVSGVRESYAVRIWRQIVRIGIREGGI